MVRTHLRPLEAGRGLVVMLAVNTIAVFHMQRPPADVGLANEQPAHRRAVTVLTFLRDASVAHPAEKMIIRCGGYARLAAAPPAQMARLPASSRRAGRPGR